MFVNQHLPRVACAAMVAAAIGGCAGPTARRIQKHLAPLLLKQ